MREFYKFFLIASCLKIIFELKIIQQKKIKDTKYLGLLKQYTYNDILFKNIDS